MNRWDTLTMGEKNQLLGIYASKGYNNLANIIAHYNSFAEGGNIDDDRDDIDNRTGKPRYRRDIHNVNITSSSENDIEGTARDTSTIGPLAFYPPKYYIGRQGNQFTENPNVTYDSWFDEHPEMIDVMTDIVGRYNNRLNNRGQQLPQLNRYYFEKLYNPEDDPIIHEAIERMLQAKWNRDVRTYNDNRTLNLWDTVEKFPAANTKYAEGGHLYQGYSEPTQKMRTLYDEASDQIYGLLPELTVSAKAPKGYKSYPMAFEKEFNDNGGIYGGFRNKDRAYKAWQTTQKYFSPENLDKYRREGFKGFDKLALGAMAAPGIAIAGAALAPIVAESAPIVGGYATKFGLPLATSIPGGKAIYNFTKNRQFAKNYVFDDVMDNLLEREGRNDFGIYPHSKHRRDDYKSSVASKYTPENNQPVLDLSLNPVKYFHNGKNPLKMSLKKILKDISTHGNYDAYNSTNVVRVNPTSWFILTPTKFKGLLGHEGQHSVQKTLDSDFALATSGKGYYINNPYNFYTREVLKPFERHNGKWIGSPDELDSEMINWKIQNNIPLSTDFINMDDSLQKKFVDLTKKRFKLKEDEAFNILHSLSKLGYFQNGGQLGHITPYGQWQYPHQITTIPSNNITMQGVSYPVVGISNTGDVKYMLPNIDYLFDGQYVTEYPVQ